MTLLTKKIKLAKKNYTVSKASWDISMLRADLEDLAEGDASSDASLKFFSKNIYPPLAACTTPLLPVDEAYKLSGNDLDNWFIEVRTLNNNWFNESELTQESITFSDGKTITVLSRRPSVIMRQVVLEQDAESIAPLDNMRRELFRSIYYPKLAGCSLGDVPSSDAARAEMSEDDLQLWYDAAKRHNPELFLAFEQLAEHNRTALQMALQIDSKKNESIVEKS